MMKQNKIKITKNFFEKDAWKDAFYVCGIDEVGRGCLAGPLVVAATILPINTRYNLLKDSKTLTPIQRIQAAIWIKKHCFSSIAFASPAIIDKYNIYRTTLLTMKKAFNQLLSTTLIPHKRIKYLLVDAMPLKLDGSCYPSTLQIRHFNYAESFSNSVAAASIIAKVTRDTLMESMTSLFVNYKMGKHKGYATHEHIKALISYGPTLIHRKTFTPKACKPENDDVFQQPIF
jgi:ribonuclease HII